MIYVFLNKGMGKPEGFAMILVKQKTNIEEAP